VARRPTLPKTDAEMQRWSAQLEAEVLSWPGVTTRPMFGFVALYRATHIFAALPRTRAIDTPFSLMVKLPSVRNDRLAPKGRRAGWTTFAMESPDDMSEALRWLERAYDRAARAKADLEVTRRSAAKKTTTIATKTK
jgi:luciferase-like monooxygenase